MNGNNSVTVPRNVKNDSVACLIAVGADSISLGAGVSSGAGSDTSSGSVSFWASCSTGASTVDVSSGNSACGTFSTTASGN